MARPRRHDSSKDNDYIDTFILLNETKNNMAYLNYRRRLRVSFG